MVARSFSDYERKVIRQDLIKACQQCWSRYGYQKTGIRELAEQAGISTGAFYQFYDSKELLFVDTAKAFQQGLEAVVHRSMRQVGGKQGLIKSLQTVAAAMVQMPWLSAVWDEWPLIERKLPPGFNEEDFRFDVVNMAEIVQQYVLTPRLDINDVRQVIDITMMSVNQAVNLPDPTKRSVDFIIDAVVTQLFD